MSHGRNSRTVLAVLAVGLVGIVPTAAQAAKARPAYRVARHVFALAAPAGWDGARTAAAQARHIPDPAFAGYLTNQPGVTSVTTRFTVPALSCTKADRAIGPGAFLLAGPRDHLLFNAANIIIGCYHGQASAEEVLVLNGAESDYARSLGPGDVISVRVTDDPASHTVVQLSDLTRRYTLTRIGRPATPNTQLVGDWGSIDARTQAQLPPPDFKPTTFRSVTIDGQPIGSTSPLGYNMETSSHVVQIVTRPISGHARNTFTCTRS
jgi:hypothetical protein